VVVYLSHISKLPKNVESTCIGKVYVPLDIRRDNGTNPSKRRNLVARLQWGTRTLLRTKYQTTELWYFTASKAAGWGVKVKIHLHLALILRMRWAIPVLRLRLHGAALNKAQDKLHFTSLLHVNKWMKLYYSVFLVSCPGARQLYGMESQHPLLRPVTAAVLRDTIHEAYAYFTCGH